MCVEIASPGSRTSWARYIYFRKDKNHFSVGKVSGERGREMEKGTAGIEKDENNLRNLCYSPSVKNVIKKRNGVECNATLTTVAKLLSFVRNT